MMNRSRPALALLGLAALLLSACRTAELYMIENLPPDSRIAVDGLADDWRVSLSMVADADASLGVTNDAENLFVCFDAESSRLQARIMTTGLTVWFDPHGGTKKFLGIRFTGRDEPDWSNGVRGGLSGLEIIRDEKPDHQSMETANALGIETGLAQANGALVYELKVPLLPSGAHPLAVGAPPGRFIGVGIDASDPDGPRVVRRTLGGLPPMGGGGAWDRGGGPGGYDMTPVAPKGLKIWGRVRLSYSREGSLAF